MSGQQEQDIARLAPYMQRRMSMLCLAGVRFVFINGPEWPGFESVWAIHGPDGKREFGAGFSDALPAQINRSWREALLAGVIEDDTGYLASDAHSLLEESDGIAPV